MAKKALSAPEIPLCINVLRLLNYRLAPDELILFDWLTVAYSGGYPFSISGDIRSLPS